MTLVGDFRFGVAGDAYTFPNVQAISDNFNNLVQQSVRLPSVSGGYDGYGSGRAPGSIGVVRLRFHITAEWAKTEYGTSDAEDAMQMARDAVGKLANMGKTKLFKPGYPSERFCLARVQDTNKAENQGERDRDTWQPVDMIFHVTDPFWYEIGTEVPEWGEFNWGDAEWGGTATPQDCDGTATTWTVTTEGSAFTLPRIEIIGRTGTATNVTLQRIVDGAVVDEISYTGTLADGDNLEINCRAKRVTLKSVNAYTSAFDYDTPDWFVLEPGDNTLKLVMANPGDEARVYVRYYEAYR